MPQAQADKLIGRVAQPLTRHFNGQGVVQPSEYLPLSDEDFGSEFTRLWQAHVNFGTSRSHKKLLGKKRQPTSTGTGTGGSSSISEYTGQDPSSARSAGQKRKHAEGDKPSLVTKTAPSLSAPSAKPASSAAAAADAQPLASKGRFAGTLAARLLGGGATG